MIAWGRIQTQNMGPQVELNHRTIYVIIQIDILLISLQLVGTGKRMWMIIVLVMWQDWLFRDVHLITVS